MKKKRILIKSKGVSMSSERFFERGKIKREKSRKKPGNEPKFLESNPSKLGFIQ
jgi:hypothetical protein